MQKHTRQYYRHIYHMHISHVYIHIHIVKITHMYITNRIHSHSLDVTVSWEWREVCAICNAYMNECVYVQDICAYDMYSYVIEIYVNIYLHIYMMCVCIDRSIDIWRSMRIDIDVDTDISRQWWGLKPHVAPRPAGPTAYCIYIDIYIVIEAYLDSSITFSYVNACQLFGSALYLYMYTYV